MPMPTLPPAMLALLAPFAPLFGRRVWPHAVVLVVGTLLAPGKRMVTAALRVLGLAWFVWRQLEVTFEETRRHLGVETQRQWSEQAIRRTTPALLGLFSLVTLVAHPRLVQPAEVTRQAAW